MSQVRVAYRWKTSDFDRLPDDPWLRFEIIDGELIVSRRPHLQHSEIIITLGSFLRSAVRTLGHCKVLASVWKKKPRTMFAPDIAGRSRCLHRPVQLARQTLPSRWSQKDSDG